VPEICLIIEKEGQKEEPPRHQKENRYDDIGDGGYKAGPEFFLEDMGNLSHISSPW